jgi:hypothetical protein
MVIGFTTTYAIGAYHHWCEFESHSGRGVQHYVIKFGFMVFNATFNNISVSSWRSVLLVKEPGVPGENQRPAASHWQTFFNCNFVFAPLWRMGPRCSSAETQVCHRSYIIAAREIWAHKRYFLLHVYTADVSIYA